MTARKSETGVILLITIATLFLIQCSTGRPIEDNPKDATAVPMEEAGQHVAEAFQLKLRSEPETVQAGEPASLVFTVSDTKGQIVKDLQIVHEKPMHLLIVSTDLAEFYHIHPEQSPDGTYRVQHIFPNGGEYKLYADFTPVNAKQIVKQIDVRVEGVERPKAELVPDRKFEKVVEGLKVTMKPDRDLIAASDVMLTFHAFDASSNKPATDLENYLGELAHFVIISEDMADFVHAHPMSPTESSTGMKMAPEAAPNRGSDGHSHSDHKNEPATLSASDVSAHTSFPRKGLYKIWAQFQRRGKVITVPFVVDVSEDEGEATSAAEVPVGATKVLVSANGYQPSSIAVKKGVPVRLAFHRTDDGNCGGELVLAKQNIRKKLPVGRTVLVEFTPTEAGEISFACGMDMFRGKLVVTEN